MFSRVAVLPIGSALALLSCASPLPLEGRACPCLSPGWVCCGSICVRPEQAVGCGAIEIPPPPPSSLPPAPTPEAETPVVAGADGGTAPVTPDAGPDLPADPPELEETCRAPARSCSADQTATRRCDERGRWVFERTCLDGTTCSAGECLCRPGTCEDSVVLRAPAKVVSIAVGGDLIYYVKSNAEVDLTGLHSLDLRTNASSAVVADAPGNGLGAMAADQAGVLSWCQQRAARGPVLMRGTQLLEAVPCGRVAVTDTHVYYTRDDRKGIFRRAVTGSGSDTIWEGEPMTFTTAGAYVYVSYQDQGAESVSIDRVSLAGPQPGRRERVAVATDPFDTSMHRIAVDETHVYGDDTDGLLRAPLEPESRFETFWRGPGPEVRGLAVGSTHVYWSTTTDALRGCVDATIWRKPKASDAPAVRIAIYPEACPSRDLLLWGGHLYTVITPDRGASQIVRLRL